MKKTHLPPTERRKQITLRNEAQYRSDSHDAWREFNYYQFNYYYHYRQIKRPTPPYIVGNSLHWKYVSRNKQTTRSASPLNNKENCKRMRPLLHQCRIHVSAQPMRAQQINITYAARQLMRKRQISTSHQCDHSQQDKRRTTHLGAFLQSPSTQIRVVFWLGNSE